MVSETASEGTKGGLGSPFTPQPATKKERLKKRTHRMSEIN